jgi:hypothetical protein
MGGPVSPDAFAIKGGLLLAGATRMAQEKAPVTSIVQSHLLKILETKKRMTQADAIWLQAHACPADLKEAAAMIEKRATQKDTE